MAAKTLTAYPYSSQLVSIDNEDLEDGDFDSGKVLGDVLGERLWRAISTACMTADGSSKPQGLALAAAKGTLGGDCPITYDRLIQFMSTVDWAYQMNASFLMHQSQLFDVMGLKSTTGQPLWQPSMKDGAPDTFLGKPYYVSNELTANTTVSANSRHFLYGDLKKFAIRYAGPTRLIRLTERYAELLRTGIVALQRVDSELIAPNATTYSPVKYYRRMDT